MVQIILHWFFYNGIGQNMVAGLIGIAVGWCWAKFRLIPKLKKHHEAHMDELRQHVRELHDKIDKLGP